MKPCNDPIQSEQFKGNQMIEDDPRAPGGVRESNTAGAESTVSGGTDSQKAGADEEQQKWDEWMESVKSFIRNIDIDNL
jgi:hypothetical protein